MLDESNQFAVRHPALKSRHAVQIQPPNKPALVVINMDMPGCMVPDKPFENIPAPTDSTHRFNARLQLYARMATLLRQGGLKQDQWNPAHQGLVQVQGVNGLAELAFDGAVSFGLDHLAAGQFAHVEVVQGGSAFGANLRGGDVQGELGQGLRDRVEQADAVFGLNLDESAGFGSFVVEADLGGNLLAGVGLVNRAGELLPSNQGREIHLFAGQRFVEDAFEALALVGAGEVAGDGVGHAVGVQRDAVSAGEDLGAEDVQVGSAEGAGDLAEEAGAVPGADFHRVVAAVGLVVPVDDGGQRVFLFGDLSAHELVRAKQIGQDVLGRMNLEVAGGQRGEVGLQFLLAQVLGGEAADFLHQHVTMFLFHLSELSGAGHQLQGLVVQRAEQQVFESVPQLVAGGLGIDKGVEREQSERFRGLHLLGEVLDHARIIQIAPLRDTGHQQVMLDHAPQHLGGGLVQLEPFGDPQGQVAARERMVAVAVGFADVVEEQG